MRLTYFKARGRAEITRLILAAAGVKYNDNQIAHEAWVTLKPKTPLGQLPVVELDENNIIIPQSLAIARYFARKHGLAGDHDLESAMIDSVVDTALDGNIVCLPILYRLQGAAKEKATEKFTEETMPQTLQRLCKLKDMFGTEGYMVGNALSWADLYVFDFLQNIELFDPSVYEKYPKLAVVRDSVLANKDVVDYVTKRK
ncbi:hypothetical protein ACOME3_004348 [Neoechinorhynchus agilis]